MDSFILLSWLQQWEWLMGPIWGPPGPCRPQMGPMLAPWTLLSVLFPKNIPASVPRESMCLSVPASHIYVKGATRSIIHKVIVYSELSADQCTLFTNALFDHPLYQHQIQHLIWMVPFKTAVLQFAIVTNQIEKKIIHSKTTLIANKYHSAKTRFCSIRCNI